MSGAQNSTACLFCYIMSLPKLAPCRNEIIEIGLTVLSFAKTCPTGRGIFGILVLKFETLVQFSFTSRDFYRGNGRNGLLAVAIKPHA